MFSTLIASAWKALLVYCSSSSAECERFRFWPIPAEHNCDPWDTLYETIVDSALTDEVQIWNTLFSCVKPTEAFFADKKVKNDDSVSALAQMRMPVVYLPTNLMERVQGSAGSAVNILQPSTALEFLRRDPDNITGITGRKDTTFSVLLRGQEIRSTC
jgi:hypothetical protein